MRELWKLHTIAAALALASSPAAAEPLSDYLRRLAYESPQVQALGLDVDRQQAELGRAALSWRPAITAGWGPRIRQDSTLPDPRGNTASVWEVTVEWTLADWGATSETLAGDRERAAVAEARAKGRALDELRRAGQDYIRAWVAGEQERFLGDVLKRTEEVTTLLNARADQVPANERQAIEAEIAGLRVSWLEQGAARELALVTLSRYGAPPKLERPTLPMVQSIDWREDPAMAAQGAAIVAAGHDMVAAKRRRLPQLKAYGSGEREGEKEFADYQVGLKVDVDLMDRAGTDLDYRRAVAARAAAAAQYEVAEQEARRAWLAAKVQEQTSAALGTAIDKAIELERKRLERTGAMMKEGRAPAIEYIFALRRVIALERQRVEAIAETARARLMVWQGPTG